MSYCDITRKQTRTLFSSLKLIIALRKNTKKEKFVKDKGILRI